MSDKGNPNHDKWGKFCASSNAINGPNSAHTGIDANTVKIAVSNLTHKKAVSKAMANPNASDRKAQARVGQFLSKHTLDLSSWKPVYAGKGQLTGMKNTGYRKDNGAPKDVFASIPKGK